MVLALAPYQRHYQASLAAIEWGGLLASVRSSVTIVTRGTHHFTDPATARATAERMAQDAGLSLSEWLQRLIEEPPADAPSRDPLAPRNPPLGALGAEALVTEHLWARPLALDDIGQVLVPSPWLGLDVNHLARIGGRADQAAHLLSRAFLEAGVEDFNPEPPVDTSTPARGPCAWYARVTDAADRRLDEIRRALTHHWTPPSSVEPLLLSAFLLLAELTPAKQLLIDLYKSDRARALRELAALLSVMSQEYRVTSRLVMDVDTYVAEALADGGRFKAIRDDLLARSGRLLTLTEAADQLGVSRQALHQRVKRGSALGVMRDTVLVLPEFQFVDSGSGKSRLVDGLREVVEPFLRSKAGALSALQFLIELEPDLGRAPIAALRDGDLARVVAAAESYLGLAED